MPSKTPKQRKFMRAAAHSKKFAKKAGIPQKVAQDYYKHDKPKKRTRQS
jgi:predicted solute-binding protein